MKKPEFNGGVIVNIDINTVTFPFLKRALQEENISEATLYPFVDQYAGTQVTALAIDVLCQYSATPSKVWDDYDSRYNCKTENGFSVDYTDMFEHYHQWYNVHGIDPHKVWFERCRQQNIEPWLSVRMNDNHGRIEDYYWLRSLFLYEAKANGWLIGKTEADKDRKELQGGFNHYDYAVPQVRQKMLDYFAEQLDMYDVDGLELDFSREWVCFDYVNCPDKVEIMNDFIRETKKVVSAAEGKWGHKIKIIARLPMDMEQCLMYGFDVRTWDKEQLVDHICITTRYESCCNDMEIDKWKDALPHTEMSAGMEVNCLARNHAYGIGVYDPLQRTVRPKGSVDTINGMAAAYACQGADAIYLYNYYVNPYCESVEHIAGKKDAILGKSLTLNLIRRIGSSDTVFSTRRRYIIMYQDYAPYGFERYCPLPVSVAAGGSTTLSLPVGYVPEEDKAHFVIGMSKGTPEDAEILVNGKPCATLAACDEETLLTLESGTPGVSYVNDDVTLYIAEIAAESLERYTIDIKANADITVDHIEIDIQ